MHYYKTTIQYEGTNYAGFQWQNGPMTVQKAFNCALEKILEGKFTTMAASRTDTGVHAIEQVVKISSHSPLELADFRELFNHELPQDIRCLAVTECSGLFRPAVESESKEYRYYFTNKTQLTKAEGQFIANISNKLDLEAIQACVEALKGTHDFCQFYSKGSNVRSTIRTIHSCELNVVNPHLVFSRQELFSIPSDLQNCFELRILANGFLKQMIRHIVSALWMVGSGKLKVEDFLLLVNFAGGVKQRWKVAPPNGLYLYKINYPKVSQGRALHSE